MMEVAHDLSTVDRRASENGEKRREIKLNSAIGNDGSMCFIRLLVVNARSR